LAATSSRFPPPKNMTQTEPEPDKSRQRPVPQTELFTKVQKGLRSEQEEIVVMEDEEGATDNSSSSRSTPKAENK
jgi:hypothetical protein